MTLSESIYTTLFRAYTRRDISQWDVIPKSHLPIFGVYHVYCGRGWQRLVSDQIGRLRRSGLLDATKRLYVSALVNNESDESELRAILSDDNISIESVSTDGRLYEYPALDIVCRKSKEEDSLIYYFHTKGISYQADRPGDRVFLKFKRRVEAWRAVMEYFLMDKWNVAVNVLQDGYDTYGCYRYPPKPAPFAMYAGNFWWATASYLRKLRPVAIAERSDRMLAERWLYTGRPNDFSPWDTLALLYRVYLPQSLYKQKDPPLADRLLFMLHFNWTKFLKKVVHYNFISRFNDKYQKS